MECIIRMVGHLEALADDTAKMLDVVANTRASYAALQKDGNARLILRIEKAIRVRHLRYHQVAMLQHVSI